MSSQLTAYRVFIASPGGLDDVRDAFRKVIQEYNEDEAIGRGVTFVPVGWELTTPGKGRPQARINEDIRECDFFVLVLHVRWGSPTSAPSAGGFSSGCEEEWAVANGESGERPISMRDVVAFFRAVPENQLADPGEQLRRVLDFRKKLETERMHLYQSFDLVSEFERHLRRLLGRWLRDHEQGDTVRIERGGPLTPLAPAREELALVAATCDESGKDQRESLAAQAEKLADEGRLVEAEESFAIAALGGADLEAVIRFGWFLWRVGQNARAKEKLSWVLAAGERAGDRRAVAIALRRLGVVGMFEGDWVQAEALLRQSLEISREASFEEGIAAAYGNLGLLAQWRGDLQTAHDYMTAAMKIEQSIGRDEGIAANYSNLGLVEKGRGNLDAADEFFRKSLAIQESIGNQSGMASSYGNLGATAGIRGNHDEAEMYFRRSLAINERIGSVVGAANQIANLGVIEQVRGNLGAAEDLYRRSLAMNEEVGHLQGIAHSYNNLGVITRLRNELDSARELFLKAFAIYQKLGLVEELAATQANLGGIAEQCGDVQNARKFWCDAMDRYRRLGVKPIATTIQTWLDRLPPDPPPTSPSQNK